MKSRVWVVHGVNFDVLELRDPAMYGGLSLAELETRIEGFAVDLGLDVSFWQTNHEGEFCELLHRAHSQADGLILNPGAWTHYSYAIRDALDVSGLPAIEMHLSAIDEREDWRAHSVIRDLVAGVVSGKGPDGYRDALMLLREELGS